MEQKNRFLSLGIALGLIAGTAAGVLVDLFTGWTFSISMGAGLGMLGGIVLGALLDQQPPASCPRYFPPGSGPGKSSEKGQALFCTHFGPLHRMIISKAENKKRFPNSSF